MPRANRYILPGYVYHLTHRCHDRKFLLKFACDREAYWRRMRRIVPQFDLSLLDYSITSNHVHVLVTAESTAEVAGFMKELQGQHAESYNGRKGRKGAFWSDRYHSTMVEDGRHLVQVQSEMDSPPRQEEADRHHACTVSASQEVVTAGAGCSCCCCC